MKIENDYLYLECELPSTKIYTTRYPALIDRDSFNKKGDMLLQIWRILPKEPFNEFYTYRGAIAEEIVDRYLTKKNYDHKWYGSQETGFDMFNNQVFGGNLDFVVGNVENLEIKSKNIKDYDYIFKNGANQTNLAQAELGTFLSGFNKGRIMYLFFTNEQEQMIKDYMSGGEKPNFDMSDVRMLTYDINFAVNLGRIQKEMQMAYDYYNKCYKEKRIPLKDISQKTLDKLGLAPKVDLFARGIDK